MNSEEICDWINTSEKWWKKYCISCGKDTKRHQQSFPKASKGVFTIAYPI